MGPYAMPIIWAVVFIFAIVFEAASTEMVAIWFMPGALVAFVISFFNVDEWIQCVVFVGITAVLLIVAMPLSRKYIRKHVGKAKTDIDLLVGHVARVEEDINSTLGTGAVKVNGQLWSAKMTDAHESAVVGEHVVIDAVEGTKLSCRKID